MASIFIFCDEHKNPFLRVCFTVIICLSAFSLFSQEKRDQPNLPSKRHLRHVVLPDQTFNSIGKIYGISGEDVANYNNLEYYEEAVLAKYLAIPVARPITKEKKPHFNHLLIQVSSKVNRQNLQTVPPTTSAANEEPGTVHKKDAGYDKQPLNTSAAIPPQISLSDSLRIKNELASGNKTSLATRETRKMKQADIEVDVATLRPASKVEKVLFLVKIQMIIALFLVVLIFLYMTLRNKKEIYKARLNGSIRKVLIAEILADQSFSENIIRGFTISEFFRKQLDKKASRQFVIDEIINGRKGIKGKAGENFLNLYLALNLEQDSCNKLKSKNWNDVAKGIQELAIMEQNHTMAAIFNEINSKNEYVRMEAQSALVRLSGFGGLWFLNILNYPISEWQQMKLISMLSTSPVSDIPDLHQLQQSV